ncbi:MAG: hypothetical protein ACKVQU_00200, partial [Burkholderiales bacterium]
MTQLQADEFFGRYKIIDQLENTSSGFSATVLLDRSTNRYILTMRSTEYKSKSQSGDFERDGLLGADSEIAFRGFAFGQLRDMEWYLGQLKTGSRPLILGDDSIRLQAILNGGGTLDVVGHSLAGHLATTFTELHPELVGSTTVFNAAGHGRITKNVALTPAGSIAAVLSKFEELLANPSLLTPEQLGLDPLGTEAGTYREALGMMPLPGRAGTTAESSYVSIYTNARYQWARTAVSLYFGLQGAALFRSSLGIDSAAAPKITQLYGHATHDDSEWTANSGTHVPATSIFIEDQPEFEGIIGTAKYDWATTHSLTLVVDSLALMQGFMKIDPNLTKREMDSIFAAGSNLRATKKFISGIGAPDAAEGDSLEVVLDALRELFSPDNFQSTPADRRAGGFGDPISRAKFYENLDALSKAGAAGKGYRIIPLVPVTQFHGPEVDKVQGEPTSTISLPQAAALVEGANEGGPAGIAYRYALRELNPFVVVDVAGTGLYGNTAIAKEGELDLYNAVSNKQGLTKTWLEDRAAFLERKLYITTLNRNKFYADPNAGNANEFGNAPDERGRAYQAEAKHFEDLTSKFVVGSGSRNRNSEQQFIFGGVNGDTIDGAGRDDHLYGGAGNDVLNGFAGDDYLQGDAGVDFLTGGTGNDKLVGGSGDDIYFFKAGDGSDQIVETREDDGKIHGRIVMNGGAPIPIGTFIKEPGGGNLWKSPNGTITLTHNSPWSLVFEDGSTLGLGEDFIDGDFGIDLHDAPVVITPTREIVGDLVRVDFGLPQQFHVDDLGNVVTDPTRPSPGCNDGLRDSAGSDHIDSGGGPDLIEFDIDTLLQGLGSNGRGGNDWIEAGEGRDAVFSGAGSDLIEGGVGGTLTTWGGGIFNLSGSYGGDLLLGGAGDDRIFGNTKIELAAAITAGNAQEGTTIRGDWLSGQAGDDILVTGADRDFLTGGSGSDLLISGAGDDSLIGDANWVVSDWNWRYRDEGGVRVYESVIGELNPTDGGNDTMYAGSGVDYARGGRGDDVIFGEGGNDDIVGEWGDDSLFGGDGNDTIFGDAAYITNDALHGNDYLDGGAGDDKLYGQGGDDFLEGNAGDDTLNGGGGADTLSGGEGDDQLFGDADNVADSQHGVDVLDGGAGNDYLRGYGGGDHLSGADGSDELRGEAGDDNLNGGEGEDALFGGDGDDILIGGAGADRMAGGAGNDTYYANEGDIIDDEQGANVFYFSASVGAADVQVYKATIDGKTGLYYSLPVEASGGTAAQGFTVVTASDTPPATFVFSSGQTLSQQQLFNLAYRDPLDVYGTDNNDTLAGFGGDDSLVGFKGDDVLSGGAGNDSLYGGDAADTYIYQRGDGHDRIADGGDTAAIDTIQFASDISISDVALVRHANGDLVVRLADGGSITVEGQFT